MQKKMAAVLALLLCALLLAGCEPLTFQNVNDLLRAPALGRGEDEIRKALTDYLGVQPQFKYPKLGEWRSPQRRADLNGNGRSEAVLLYSLPDQTGVGGEKGNNVYVALLEQRGGVWTVVQDVRGLSTEVASLDVVDLLDDGTMQLLVGFANANLTSKTLALYTYNGQVLTLVYQWDYSIYRIGDFTGRQKNDLIVVSRGDTLGGLQMQYLPTGEGRFLTDEMPVPVALDSNFESCAAIVPGKGWDGSRVLVVDGVTSAGTLTSQLVYYTGERFYTEDPNPLRGDAGRQSPLLKTRDVDADGVAEIPLRVGRREIETLKADKRMEYVEWVNFAVAPGEAPQVKEFGILDSDRSVYIRLPDEWRGEVEVEDGEGKGEWVLRRRRGRTELLSLQVLEPGDLPPVGASRVPGTSATYLIFSAALTVAERDTVRVTFLA